MLIGWGMAGGVWETAQEKAVARTSITADGRLTMSSTNTGTYTIMTQIAAQTLGLPLEAVTFVLGDTMLPEAPVQGGSKTTASVGSAVEATCDELGEKILKLAQQLDDSPLKGAAFADVQFVDDQVRRNDDVTQSVVIRDVLQASGEQKVEAEASAGPDIAKQMPYSMPPHTAVFVEVKVDEDLGTVHVTRVANAVAAGRILNPKTARSQGAGLGGVGHQHGPDRRIGDGSPVRPLHEPQLLRVPHSGDGRHLRHRRGAGGGRRRHSEPAGHERHWGVGLLGVAAAVANAVYHATGKRVRDLPVSLDKLL